MTPEEFEKWKKDNDREKTTRPLLQPYRIKPLPTSTVQGSKKKKKAQKTNHIHLVLDEQDYNILNGLVEDSKLPVSSIMRLLIRYAYKVSYFDNQHI